MRLAAPAVRQTRRALKILLIAAGSVVALLLGLVAWIAFVGIDVDASALRPRLAAAFSQALGREVRFDGAARLEISGSPGLKVGGLHVSDPGGFARGTLASLGEVRLSLDLWQLLRQRLHVQELVGRQVTLRLDQPAPDRNNWTFGPPAPPPAAPETPADPRAAAAGREAALMLDIRRVSLEAIALSWTGPDRKPHHFDLDTLAGEAPLGRDIVLDMKGRVEKAFPYRVGFRGGPLQDLLLGRKGWPLHLEVDFLSTRLRIDGTREGAGGDLRFSVGTDDLSELERLLQSRFPRVGALALAGRLRFDPRHAELTELTGSMGRSSLSGQLSFDRTGPVPRLSGRLAMPALDLRPFLADRPDTPEEPPRSLRETYRELAAATFSLKALRAAELDLELAVDRWLSLPGDARDARLRLRLTGGRLEAPLSVTAAGVTLTGRLRVDASTEQPDFALALEARDSPLGGLAELLAGIPGVQGQLGRFSLDLSARGDTGAELVGGLDVRVGLGKARLAYGHGGGGRPVAFTVDDLSVALPAHRALAGHFRGSLLGQPLEMDLSGGTLERVMLDESTPLDFRARSRSLRAHLTGILTTPSAQAGPSLSFDVSAERTDDVARWLGVAPGASARVALRGRASLTQQAWQLDQARFALGHSTLEVTASGSLPGSAPRLRARLHAARIDAAELQSLLPPPAPGPAVEQPSRPVLEIPILPHGIDLGDAEVEVRVGRVDGTPLAVRDIAFDGRVEGGAMRPSAFSATVLDVPFRGAVSLDLRGREPSSNLWLATGRVDVGQVLRRLGLASDVEATVEGLRLSLAARASLLGDLLARSSLEGEVDGARITLRDRNTRAAAVIAVERGHIGAKPGAPVRLDLDGRMDTTPVRIGLETAPAAELVRPEGRIPFRLTAGVPGLDISLDGQLAKPVGTRDIELALHLKGARLDRLDPLVRTALPPWGPYSLDGRFRLWSRGYEVSDLSLAVASSRLRGRGALLTDGARPRLDVELSSPLVQLDDFPLGQWTAGDAEPRAAAGAEQDLEARAADASDQAQRLLSPAVLKRQDAHILVRVDEVLSGRDRLGSGRLEAHLADGRAELGPLEVQVPGGSARLLVGYEPDDKGVAMSLRAQAERFDYGVLMRRFQPDADLAGTFSLDLDVNARSRRLADVLRHGTGRVDVAVWPRDMKAGLVDLWAVNVLVALLPSVDPASTSRINCAVARFRLEDGLMTDRAIVLDTTRMRVTGQGQADFRTEALRLRLQPQAKQAQFLSLATPVEVGGTFRKPAIGVSTGDVLGTLGRLATSIFWVPIRRLSEKPLPADGSDVCAAGLGPPSPASAAPASPPPRTPG